MKLEDLLTISKKPKLYEKGSAFMWTDSYISEQLLQVHLNPESNLASRQKSSIDKTTQWILETTEKNESLTILDLGCGPGLYTEIFEIAGHCVTGIDISANSINHAIESAQEKKLTIEYFNSDYLNIDLGSEIYDLVVLIYTDFGVLLPKEREQLLANIFRSLKKGGVFIFDVLNDKRFYQKMSPKTWEAKESGFWKEYPYLALSESFLYEQEKLILYQHTIIDAMDKLDIYRFWTHFFSRTDLLEILQAHKFRNIEFRDDVLPESDMWNGKNVIFAKCEK